jgi:hypothetical protein
MTAHHATPLFWIEFADHPQYGQIEPCIEVAVIRGPLNADTMIAASKQMLSFATLTAAGKFVDHDAFQTDEEYMARNTEIADQLRPSAIRLAHESVSAAGAIRPTTYALEGLNWEQREWRGVVAALNAEEAQFQARWQMALEGAPAVTDVDTHIAAMERAVVTRCEVTTTLESEMAAALPQP